MLTLTEMQMKDIIIIEDGRRIGHISDLEIDVDSGKIIELVISTKGKVMGLFGNEQEMIIPWENIVTIGSDVILVKNQQQPRLYPDNNKQY